MVFGRKALAGDEPDAAHVGGGEPEGAVRHLHGDGLALSEPEAGRQ